MWEEEIAVSREAARSAGEILKGMFGRVNEIREKGRNDLVTEADLRAEKHILDIICRRFPHDAILSEEAGTLGAPSDRIWLIDPLDGTTNFAHGFPFFAVSIALEVEEEIVLGIVFNPRTEEYFEAAKGMGASLNKRPICVSNTPSLGEALLATGFPYDIHKDPDRVMRHFTQMLLTAQGVRRPGSAALDLSFVAAGRLDGFWEEGLHPWDTAAGTLIVREAGGEVSTYDGEPYSPYTRTVVAANPLLRPAMTTVLNQTMT
jgi:myo-inositol-1(or 4)-monophosphatase